jgi:hypothetical protein
MRYPTTGADDGLKARYTRRIPAPIPRVYFSGPA